MTADLKDVVTLILAGGEGKRLGPLTRNRSKPSVPFGGKYRIIDFMMSNCLNSGLTNILVLTQYRSHELNKHLRLSWPSNTMHGFSVEPVPAQQIHGRNGTVERPMRYIRTCRSSKAKAISPRQPSSPEITSSRCNSNRCTSSTRTTDRYSRSAPCRFRYGKPIASA